MKTSTLKVGDVHVGDELPAISFPLTIYRLVMWAGAGRDFNSIHHNREWAQQTGAPDMYANTLMLMGMWERLVREWAGPAAIVTGIRGFRMRRFSVAGETIVTRGTVAARDANTITVDVSSADRHGVTVGPGQVIIHFPTAPTVSDEPLSA